MCRMWYYPLNLLDQCGLTWMHQAAAVIKDITPRFGSVITHLNHLAIPSTECTLDGA